MRRTADPIVRLDDPLWPKGPNVKKLVQLCASATIGKAVQLTLASLKAPGFNL